jgi:hypothetical protein
MPETIEAPAPTSVGINEMVDAKFATPAPDPAPPEPAKPAETPAPTTPKPETTTDLKPAAKKDFADDEIEKERKSNPNHKAWKILDSIKAKFSTSEAALKSKLAELESRPQTPANDAKIAELEKLIAERDGEVKTWKQRVEEADFTRSEEYASKYVKPYQGEMERALNEVKGLSVTYEKDGEQLQRAATEADFRKALSLQGTEQDNFVYDTFGRSAQRVTNRINELNRIKEAANHAVTDFAANYEKNKVARELEAKRQQAAYEKELNEAHSNFQKDPDTGRYLTEAETDPEGTKMFKSALEKFDSFRTNPPTAADAAEVRAAYAMKPRLIHEVKQLTSKVASLEAEIAKYRGADPGAPVKTVTGATQTVEPKGIDGMVSALKWDGSK